MIMKPSFRIPYLLWIIIVICIACRSNPNGTNNPGEIIGQFRVETIVSGLDTPWDLAWGPDNNIWFTERRGIISRYNPADGSVRQIGQVDTYEQGESGLMSIAFHPDFISQPDVFAVYSYGSGAVIRNRLVSMRYNGTSLGSPNILLDDIPGSSIHNGSRLTIGPDRLLYMTTGDASQSDLAQNLSSASGKVLRLTLNGAPAPGNPFGTAVYSYGHRNPQGIAFNPIVNALYVTEHGPNDNDEVNYIDAGRNYGWPIVRGFCDGDVPNEVALCQELKVAEPVTCWTPTIAPAGMAFYDSNRIPGWRGNLLFTTLKGSALYRLVLSSDGRRVTNQEILFQGQFGRLRDVITGPDGELYLATSNRDGRGTPAANDDRILRLTPVEK